MHGLISRCRRDGTVLLTLLLALLGSSIVAQPVIAEPPKTGDGTGGVKLQRLGGFDEPVYSATAPGRASRNLLFVVEREGTVRVIKNGNTLDKPFIDVSDDLQLLYQGSPFNELGLLSIAFDPGYARNGRFYLYMTTLPDADITVIQYERKGERAAVADPDSGREVISIARPAFPNHNGGQVSFGPDGNMWISTGDGGFACDPYENASDLDSLLGKLLRITPKANGGYTVPPGNPFVGEAGADEIYAYGLRNPFRFSFDAKADAIGIGDVGQDRWEEINYQKIAKAKGADYGWDGYEGEVPLVLSDFCLTGGGFIEGDTPSPLPDGSTFPIHVYPHWSGNPDRYAGCAVIGGPVVRDKSLKSLYGRYLYSDSCTGGIQSFVAKPSGSRGDVGLGKVLNGTSSITTGRRNAVYATSILGPVYRLDPSKPRARRNVGSSGGDAAVGRGVVPTLQAKRLGSFDDPVYVVGPAGAKGLRFVVEKPGRIIAVGPGGKRSTFLDIRGKVSDSGFEQGLLSVAFAPDYARSRLLYVYFTDDRGDIVIAELKRSAKNPKRAKAKSFRRVIAVKHRLNENHNGGQVQFGPDGYLYFGTGDGGAGGDPDENALNRDSLLGKLIRIDPKRRGSRPYTVPSDNPFVGAPGRDEIYSLGLRNPYRFSFDRDNGRLAIGDVGQGDWEELNYLTPAAANGANFGWDAYEGPEPYRGSDATDPRDVVGPVTFPIFAYDHSGGRCAITGGYVSRDPQTPSLEGRYLYADFCQGEIRSLIPGASAATDDRRVAGLPEAKVSSFGEDARGRLYFTDLDGGVFRIANGG